MKQAFSLLELAFCIVILSFVFGSYYLIFVNKSLDVIWQNQILFNEEKELLMQNPSYKVKEININTYNFLEYTSDEFKLKSLKIKDLSYEEAFIDEKSF
ncbi:hypothetical protein CSUB8523_1229 [Campylobacter subantarcticus LMG 24377]|uniref:Type II secretion system protein n=1 Tax=Campylobacter subantarcticus TaxID=497724 RepID=A0ABW9N470_9BACT|nr:hypothetical protein [Campylobacter subantarcticus]AJC92736.1 hypothetical protein CSUB8523_1229 [Campylobacter subantarcticus LMG 24377]EAL3938158.1 hypothetical protein [Campylobacter lari]MPB99085.1 hypothetical protein [Campylobacter subantarcticus]